MKILDYAPKGARCDCEREGCCAGDCTKRATYRVELFGMQTNLCVGCTSGADHDDLDRAIAESASA